MYMATGLVIPGCMLCLYQAYNVYTYGLTESAIHNVWVPLFAAFVGIWATLVIEKWKRKASELAFRWDTDGVRDAISDVDSSSSASSSSDTTTNTAHATTTTTRSEFKGPEIFNEVNNTVEKHFLKKERRSRMCAGCEYIVSLFFSFCGRFVSCRFF